MRNEEFEKWVWNATWLVRYPPDRTAVQNELRDHLQERYDDLIDRGATPEEATVQTLDAMGDAKAIAVPLGELHKPFWGLLVQWMTLAVVVLAALAMVGSYFFLREQDFGAVSKRDFPVFSEESYGGDTGRTLLHLSKPNDSFTCDGSTFTLTDAAIFTEEYPSGAKTRLYVRIQRRTPLPWMEYSKGYWGLLTSFNSYTSEALHVVDSKGHYYPSFADGGWESNFLVSSGAQTGLFTYTFECWINDFDTDTGDWVEIRYTRDGRDECLRIPLNGGGQ